jgi:hypothetical protein
MPKEQALVSPLAADAELLASTVPSCFMKEGATSSTTGHREAVVYRTDAVHVDGTHAR